MRRGCVTGIQANPLESVRHWAHRRLRSVLPCTRHKSAWFAGEHVDGPGKIPGASLRGLQTGEVAEDLLFAAWDQHLPILVDDRICCQSLAEPSRHAILGPASIGGVEFDLDLNPIPHRCTRGLANLTMKVKKEAAISDGHQIDVPGLCRFAVKAHQDRKGFAPAGLDGLRSMSTDQDQGINASDFDDRRVAYAHGHRIAAQSRYCAKLPLVARSNRAS